MPFLSGGASKILIAKAGDSNYIGFPFISESFNPGGTFISSNAILGDRVRGIGDKGNPTADGSTDVEFRFENLPVFMYAALGDISFSGASASAPNTRLILPNNSSIPAYDIVIQHGSGSGGKYIYKFSNVYANSLRFSVNGGAPLAATVDWIGMSWSELSSTPVPTVEINKNVVLFPSKLSALTWKATSDVDLLNYATTVEFTINNNVAADNYKLDASGRFAVVPGEFSLTGTLEIITPDDSDTVVTGILQGKDIGDNIPNIWIEYSDIDRTEAAVSDGAGVITLSTLDAETVYKVVDASDGVTEYAINSYDYAANTITISAASTNVIVYGKAKIVIKLQNLYITAIAHDVNDRGNITHRIDWQAAIDTSKSGVDQQPIVVDISGAGYLLLIGGTASEAVGIVGNADVAKAIAYHPQLVV